MEAKVYVYAYLLLSLLYVAGCIAYLNSVTRTASLSRARQDRAGSDASPLFASEEEREDTQVAVRSVLIADSAAFACAVVPVAYVGVTGLLANLLGRNTSAAGLINPLWLVATVAVLGAHMFFLMRIISANSKLQAADRAVFTPTFVSRHVSMLTYYRVFLGAVAVFTAANSLYLVANLSTFTSLRYIM